MVTDIILLDMFNSLGMPTSTTVSLVFELLGATFVVALFKISEPGSTLGLGDLLNTEKALSVILGIFLSVAIAFVFGTIVQFITRLIFTFEYRSRMKWKVGIFGGVACTAIVYFMLIKGIKDLTIMTPELKAWIDTHTALIIGVSFAGFTVTMQALHFLKVNILKVVVLLGTFALAMAFAGNDLVNFIGVPLTSLASYQDYTASGGGNLHGFMMASLNGPAATPFYFLIGAGMIMVVALASSKKSRQVTQTTVGLSSTGSGDELFGSSRLGRALVRRTLSAFNTVSRHTPERVKRFIARRMDTTVASPEEARRLRPRQGLCQPDACRRPHCLGYIYEAAAVDDIRHIHGSHGHIFGRPRLGTRERRLPHHRRHICHRRMVYNRRCGIHRRRTHRLPHASRGRPADDSRRHNRSRHTRAQQYPIPQKITRKSRRHSLPDHTVDRFARQCLALLIIYINEKQEMFLNFVIDTYKTVSEGFINDNVKQLSRAERLLVTEKDVLKSQRRKLTLCLRRATPAVAIEKSTWFHPQQQHGDVNDI